ERGCDRSERRGAPRADVRTGGGPHPAERGHPGQLPAGGAPTGTPRPGAVGRCAGLHHLRPFAAAAGGGLAAGRRRRGRGRHAKAVLAHRFGHGVGVRGELPARTEGPARRRPRGRTHRV
ncbi:MAG: single-strand binding protein/Primosomal replication protein n, partial [uncultured Friedmanniella sp.]